MGKVSSAHFFDKDYVPKTLDEFYNSGWKEYLLYHIRRYQLNDVNHSPEDLLQDMMVQMARTNYIEKFDPEVAQGNFMFYIKVFLQNFMSKPYAKEHRTKHGQNIVNHLSLVNVTDQEEASPMEIDYDSVGYNESSEDLICLLDTIESGLRQIKTESAVEYNGVVLNRDPFTVYKMLLSGYEIKEIAEIFGTSKQLVYSLRKKILSVVQS